MRFIVFPKLSIENALDIIQKIEQWFKENPSRKVCNTENFKVRRGFVGTDILKHTAALPKVTKSQVSSHCELE